MCAETNHEGQEGIVMNTTMGSLTTVKRAVGIYGAATGTSPGDVTSAALLEYMLEICGNRR